MGFVPPPLIPKRLTEEETRRLKDDLMLRHKGYEPIKPTIRTPVFDWLMSIIFTMIVVGAVIELIRILCKWLDNFLAGG